MQDKRSTMMKGTVVVTSSEARMLFLSLLLIVRSAAAEFGSCGVCHCIPAAGEECPKKEPETDFSKLVPKLKEFTWANPTFLPGPPLCNPYADASCDTVPEPLAQDGGACVVDLIEPPKIQGEKRGKCPTNWAYTTRSYPGTFEEAVAAGERVTHTGPCGLCSSLQDLAVYMEKGADLSQETAQCGLIATQNPQDPALALQCLEGLGFTAGCASIWFLNVLNTFQNCLATCLPFLQSGAPPNGPPPTCELADCLACDEASSGPVFKKFAGRTRRTSGLLSNIAQPCDDLVDLDHRNPCKKPKKQMMTTKKKQMMMMMMTSDSKEDKPSKSKKNRTQRLLRRKIRGL